MAGFTTNKTHARAVASVATRRRFLVWGTTSAALCLFPLLAGCSGGSKKDAPDSNYIGSYRAAYTIPGVGENGTFSFSVAQKGDMLGSFVDSSSNASRAFAGHVDNNGTFSGTTTDTNGSTTFATSGTISKVISSSTGGDFRQNRNGTTVSGSFSYLTTGVTAATDSPYAGAFSGSYNLSGQTAGPASYSIDKQGIITGFVTTNGETGTLRGQVNNTGALVGTVNYASGQASVTGALAIAATPGVTSGNVVETKNGVSTPGTFGGAIAPPADSPYTGAYSGSFNLSGQNAGPASYSIDKQGNITGLVTTNGETGTLHGQVSSSGAFTGTIAYPSGQATIGGSLASSTDGTTSGNFTQTKDNATTPGSFGGPIALPADSPYIGSYQGTYGVPDKGETGSLSLTVDVSGKLLGSFDNGSPVGVFAGSMTADGNFSGTISYPAGSAAQHPARTISGKMSTKQGGTASPVTDLKMQGDFLVDNGQSTPNLPGSFDITRTDPKNTVSIFRGTFLQGATRFLKPFTITGSPAGITAQSGLSITVDQEGKFIGFLDDGTRLEGSIANDGRMSATATPVASITGYAVTGKASLQQVSVDSTIYSTDPTAPVTPTFTKSAGIAANFQINVNGTNYPGVFTATGGFQSGQ